MVIKKATWTKVRQKVHQTAASKKILGVDTKISHAVRGIGLKIRLMRGMYVFHYLRLEEGFDYNKHLL